MPRQSPVMRGGCRGPPAPGGSSVPVIPSSRCQTFLPRVRSQVSWMTNA